VRRQESKPVQAQSPPIENVEVGGTLGSGLFRPSLKLLKEIDKKSVDRQRPLSLYPVPGAFEDMAATQAGQGLAEVVNLRR